ncbi:hypothetical protein BKA57DRAFT_441940 [Linnemannia elongata]|nr:hypothetical protein BKA57DRAFT_441940 [Linnemannia elongata]
MSDHPLDQLDPYTPGSDSANNAGSIRKRDKIREIWGFSKSKTKEIRPYAPTQSLNSRPLSQESTRPTSLVSQASNSPSGDNQADFSGITMQDKPLPPPPPTEAQPLADIFLDNLPKPSYLISSNELRGSSNWSTATHYSSRIRCFS